MSFINDKGSITLNRGDCFKAPLFINIGTELEPIRLDFKKFLDMEVYLGIYLPGSRFEDSFIFKKFTYLDSNNYGDVVISLDPKDTIYIQPGKYYYTIKAKMYDKECGDWMHTVIDRQDFYIM